MELDFLVERGDLDHLGLRVVYSWEEICYLFLQNLLQEEVRRRVGLFHIRPHHPRRPLNLRLVRG